MSENRTPVGLIGVGLLGTAIAERLLEHGHAVLGFDGDASRREQLSKLHGRVATSASDVFRECQTILLSLPDSGIAAQVLEECQSVFQDNPIVIDTTTGDPDEMAAAAERLRGLGVNYVEATVAGSSRQLRAGTATLFVGGDEESIASVQPLLDVLSRAWVFLGPAGSASRFKLVHNLLLGLHRAVLAEGLCFAESLGFPPATALEILKETPAMSAVMETKGAKMVCRDWQPEARLSQHLKDVRLILALAEQSGINTPLSRVHRELLELAEQLGFGDADNSAILEAYLADRD